MFKLVYTVEGFLVGLIGRPLLWFIKWMRWMWPLAGLWLSQLVVYDPTAHSTTIIEKFTPIPFFVGLILFAVGTTIKRYDEMYAEAHQAHGQSRETKI